MSVSKNMYGIPKGFVVIISSHTSKEKQKGFRNEILKDKTK